MSHALLSPSGASRWLACPPSARLEEKFQDSQSEAAAEGTIAHKLGESIIRQKAGMLSKVQYNKIVKEITASFFKLFPDKKESDFNEMMNYADDYAVFVMERFSEAQSRTKDAMLYVETLLKMDKWVPEGYGTGDINIVADRILDFIDLKYGKGVEVSAVENKQMMLYALGALEEFSHLYDIDMIRMTIYQPRMDNISEWEITVEALHAWAEDELAPIAKLAFEGKGEFAPGKHCQFCKARPTCKAHADHQLEIAQYDFKAPLILADEEVSDILSRTKEFESWLKEVKDYALSQAVNNQKKWPGFKLVEGRSDRKYIDQDAVAKKLLELKIPKEKIYKPTEIFGITEMEKQITKKVFAAELSDLVEKPPGKPTLAPVTDKRPELNSLEKATADFAEEFIAD